MRIERNVLLGEAALNLRRNGYGPSPFRPQPLPIDGGKIVEENFESDGISFVNPSCIAPLMQFDLFPGVNNGKLAVRAINSRPGSLGNHILIYRADGTPSNPEQAKELEEILNFKLFN